MGALSFIKRFFKPDPRSVVAGQIYGEMRDLARQPSLYLEAGVPDTFDGRFEMVTFHLFAVLNRLKDETAEGKDLSQRIFDAAFADFDVVLREHGLSDDGVAKRIKVMAEAVYGRLEAYDKAIEADGDSELSDVIGRNVYRGGEATNAQVSMLCTYLRGLKDALAATPLGVLMTGRLGFKGEAIFNPKGAA